jgi:hypothetical protein
MAVRNITSVRDKPSCLGQEVDPGEFQGGLLIGPAVSDDAGHEVDEEIFGMIERGGEVRIAMRPDVKQKTIRPRVEETIVPGTLVNTDDTPLQRLTEVGIGAQKGVVPQRRGVCPRRGWRRLPRDPCQHDGGILVAVALRLRPHRRISQEKLPVYPGFFEFVYNARWRGRALLGTLLDTLLQPVACPQNPT